MNFRHMSIISIGSSIKNYLKRFSTLSSDINISEVGNKDVLKKINEDLSSVNTYFPVTFNIAAYVNSSETLQNLINLNVNLSKIEKRPDIVKKMLKLNFNDNIKTHILFLKDYVDADSLGGFITKNPLILCESIEDLTVRINYLASKKFDGEQIGRIVTKNPFWLMLRDLATSETGHQFKSDLKMYYLQNMKIGDELLIKRKYLHASHLTCTTRIDRRLGYFQDQFSLSGDEVRHLAYKQPKLITYNLHHIKTNSFVIKEEMGFSEEETKYLLLKTPKLWMLNQEALLERFTYIHNNMKIPHSAILDSPHILLSRNFRVKQRNLFLETLGRAQYDPKKENYVPITALVENTDVEFCKKYAKCNVSDFNSFLTTM